jgi:RimJ/RimL family protein N-acetyltransferase
MSSIHSSTHTYRGDFEVNFFFEEDQGLTVTIDTDHLHLRSVTASEKDLSSYTTLFGDPESMKTFASGNTMAGDEVAEMVQGIWAKRWRENDPYSAMAVFKRDTDDFVGHITLSHGEHPGEAETGYLFAKAHWGKGYASEAATAVIQEYAPATVKEGYLLEGKPLTRITGTAKFDNVASLKILQKVGMKKIGEGERYGALRHYFAKNL